MNVFSPEIIENAILREPIVLGENEKVFTKIDNYDVDIEVMLSYVIRDGKVIILNVNRKLL